MNYTEKLYTPCALCPRECGVDRLSGVKGRCGMSREIKIARTMLHMWEEPIISGTRGSGAIFFVGCPLGCIYCQNKKISRGKGGSLYTEDTLAEEMLSLEKSGAHNINLVTPTHYVPSIIESVGIAKAKGLSVPVVYNTSSYEKVETLRLLENTAHIYLADIRYYRPNLAAEYSLAPDYPGVARSAIAEMVRQKPQPIIEDGIMKSGVIVRILLLPGMLADAKLNLKHLVDSYGDNIYVSLMSQYTPSPDLKRPLDRRVTIAEYDELVEYAEKLGVKNAFIQERESAVESFIPEFS